MYANFKGQRRVTNAQHRYPRQFDTLVWAGILESQGAFSVWNGSQWVTDDSADETVNMANEIANREVLIALPSGYPCLGRKT